MRYRLRTLLIVLALAPPLLAWAIPPLVSRFSRQQPQLKVNLNYHGTLPDRMKNGMVIRP